MSQVLEVSISRPQPGDTLLYVAGLWKNRPGGVVNTTTRTVMAIEGGPGIQSAIDSLNTAGGGLVQMGAGTFNLTAKLTMRDKVAVRGMGMGVTVLQQTVLATRAFEAIGNVGDYDYMAFEDFTVRGMWFENQGIGGDNDRHFAINGVRRLRFSNVESLYCRQMGITAANSDEIIADGCRIRYVARDGFNFTGSKRCIVVNNHISNGYDDAIAIHQSAASANPPAEGHIIANNVIEDCNGIKCLGITKARIFGNTLRRMKAYGIYTLPGGTEGYADQVAVDIGHNIITDVINGSKFGQGSECVAIHVANKTTSWALPIVGGATPVINKPDALYYLSNSVSAQNAGGQGINIHNNVIFGFTLPASAAYTTWGYGQAFTSTGFIDPDMSSGFQFNCDAIRIQGGMLTVNVYNNHMEGLLDCVVVGSTLVGLDQISIKNNTLRRFSDFGVSFESSAAKQGRAFLDNNIFDADPYFESANRTLVSTIPDGTWNSVTVFKPCAIDTANWKGLVGRGNSFRNIHTIFHTNGNSAQTISNNTYFMQPDATATLAAPNIAANKGIYSPGGIGHDTDLLVWENSDPTSATYGQEIGRSAFRSSALPTSGNYIAGMFVRNMAFVESGSAAAKYTIVGWKRLTTSATHVLNTDWRELRCLTGN